MRLCLSILLSTAAFAQQTDWISQIRNKPFPDTRTYIWSQNVSGNISIGSNTKTLTPCPLGLNGTDTGRYIYISGGTGTAEAVLSTGLHLGYSLYGPSGSHLCPPKHGRECRLYRSRDTESERRSLRKDWGFGDQRRRYGNLGSLHYPPVRRYPCSLCILPDV